MFARLITQLLEHELECEQYNAELNRQSNLATVLNRVLRHNLRNHMTVIRGYTEQMSDKLGSPTQGEAALNSIDSIIELSDTARELEKIVNTEFQRKAIEITQLVENVAQTVQANYPNATITVEYEDAVTADILPSLERALHELIENAAKHGGASATVTITVIAATNAVEIRVTDDGPGLEEMEAEVLKTGSETPLVHGTGLGLWLAHWIVTSHGGSVDATDINDGTSMRVSVPRNPNVDIKENLTELRQARDQYKAGFEQARDAMVIVDDDGRIIDANSSASRLYGMDEQSLLGQPLARFFIEDFDFEAFRKTSCGEGAKLDTMVVCAEDGVERTVEHSAANNIVPGQTLIISRDITEQRRRNQELRETKQRLELALAGTETGVWQWNMRTDEIIWDETIGQSFNFDPGTLDAFEQRVHPDDREQLESDIRTAIENDMPFESEYRIRRDDGEQVPVLARGEVSTNERGSQMNGIVTDITEQKQRERELHALNERYESLLNAAPDPVFLADVETGEILDLNEAAEELTGKPKETLVGSHQSALHPTEDAELYQGAFKRGIQGQETIQALADGSQPELTIADGSTVPIEISASRVSLRDGPVIFGIFRNAETKEKTERLETINSVLSHDIRNPLNVAQARLELLKEASESEHIPPIERAHDRIGSLLEDVSTLTQSGDTADDTQPLELHQLIESCWQITETGDATLVSETERTIQANKSRLQRLIENLLRNAVEHGGDGIAITVGELDDGFYIEDNGSGIAADKRDRIFDSGYSTRTEGTGLGLSIVKSVAEAHGWEVSITESDAGGARFEITGVEFTAG